MKQELSETALDPSIKKLTCGYYILILIGILFVLFLRHCSFGLLIGGVILVVLLDIYVHVKRKMFNVKHLKKENRTFLMTNIIIGTITGVGLITYGLYGLFTNRLYVAPIGGAWHIESGADGLVFKTAVLFYVGGGTLFLMHVFWSFCVPLIASLLREGFKTN